MLYYGFVSRLINVLLLAAGKGTRLRPITNNIPKCLVKIGDKPLLEYWLNILYNSTIVDKIYINVCYLSEQVVDYVKKHKLSNKIILLREEKLLGTGGTLVKLLREIQNENPIFFAHADNFTDFDIDKFYKAHLLRPKICGITMMTFVTDDPESCGVVSVNEDGVVVDFHEKSNKYHGNLANGAIFMIDKDFQIQIKNLKNIEDFSAEVIPKYLNKIFTYENKSYLLDIGTPEKLLKARELLKSI
jgi:mannose-1-phosphate guanylyltransferase